VARRGQRRQGRNEELSFGEPPRATRGGSSLYNPRMARTFAVVAVGIVYALFAAACFRLALVNENEVSISVGEGLFTLIGAVGLLAAAVRGRDRALIVLVGTLPLVGWFIATPWNSGPPFLIASLVVPMLAALLFALARSGSSDESRRPSES
jgi:hypothetical protein